jgi:RNA polymerase sigma-70 factor, ECF subfamily
MPNRPLDSDAEKKAGKSPDSFSSQPEPARNSRDLEVLERIRARDPRAAELLFDLHAALIHSVALHVLQDKGDAEDVLQEVLLQVWNYPEKFDAARGSLSAWLTVVTRHRAIDHLRRRKNEVDFTELKAQTGANFVEAAELSERSAKLQSVLGGIPDAQRRALELAYFEGLSHTEISDRTGEPLGTIKSRIRSGLSLLRRALLDEAA